MSICMLKSIRYTLHFWTVLVSNFKADSYFFHDNLIALRNVTSNARTFLGFDCGQFITYSLTIRVQFCVNIKV